MCAMTGNSISLERKRPGLNTKKNLAFYVMTNTVKDNFYSLGLTGDRKLLIRAAKPMRKRVQTNSYSVCLRAGIFLVVPARTNIWDP